MEKIRKPNEGATSTFSLVSDFSNFLFFQITFDFNFTRYSFIQASFWMYSNVKKWMFWNWKKSENQMGAPRAHLPLFLIFQTFFSSKSHLTLIPLDTLWFKLVFECIQTWKSGCFEIEKNQKTKWGHHERIFSCFFLIFFKLKTSTFLRLNTFKNDLKSKSIDGNQSRMWFGENTLLAGRVFLPFPSGWRLWPLTL